MVVTLTSQLCRQNLLLGLSMLAVGMVVVIWPEKIQRINIRWHERHPKLSDLNPFADWIRTAAALTTVRASGVVLIGFSLLVSFFAWKACSP